jgi:hypothetical protein
MYLKADTHEYVGNSNYEWKVKIMYLYNNDGVIEYDKITTDWFKMDQLIDYKLCKCKCKITSIWLYIKVSYEIYMYEFTFYEEPIYNIDIYMKKGVDYPNITINNKSADNRFICNKAYYYFFKMFCIDCLYCQWVDN